MQTAIVLKRLKVTAPMVNSAPFPLQTAAAIHFTLAVMLLAQLLQMPQLVHKQNQHVKTQPNNASSSVLMAVKAIALQCVRNNLRFYRP